MTSIENRVDKMLKSIIARYKDIEKDSDFTFSMKIKLLDSMRLIPRSITRGAHLIRKIRNEFAHNLDKVDFGGLKKEVVNEMDCFVKSAYQGKKNEEQWKLVFANKRKCFNDISIFVIIGLDRYFLNVTSLNSRIQQSEFINAIYSEAERDNDEILKLIEALPIGVSIKRKNLLIQKISQDNTSITVVD